MTLPLVVTRIALTSRSRLPAQASFDVMGTVWQVSSNSEELLETIQETFPLLSNMSARADLSLFFQVNRQAQGSVTQHRPHFRALDHLYYASFGPHDSMVIDQQHRRVVGQLSIELARDKYFWKHTILPVLVGIVSASIGITPVHCACVAKNDGTGLLLGGASGSGKSTLAVTLASTGFNYLADDCTYLSRAGTEICAWGLPIPAKLLPESVAYFPQLRDATPRESLNGEIAFQVNPADLFGSEPVLSCEPQWLIFIERCAGTRPSFQTIGSQDAANRLVQDLELLPERIADQRGYQLETIKQLVDRECWVLRHGVSPQELAEVLAPFCGL
jgi:hypothetical protein